jgi:hypothetical protein
MSNNNCGCNNTTTTHACNSCQSTPCTPQPICDCPGGYMSSDCVNNVKAQFECLNIESNQTLTETFEQMDSAICDKFAEVDSHFDLVNVGTGEDVYKGINLLGQKEIKTIKSAGGTVTITTSVDGNEINLEAGESDPVITSNDNTVTITETVDGVDLSVDLDKSFLELTDTPNDYTSDTLKLVRVKTDETGLEFVTDNSIKQVSVDGNNLTITSGAVAIPNASETVTGVITHNGVQKIKGTKEFKMLGNSSNITYGFTVSDSAGIPAFQIAEADVINVDNRRLRLVNSNIEISGDKLILFYATGTVIETVGVLTQRNNVLSLGSNNQTNRRIRIGTDTGNVTIGAPTDSVTTTGIFEVFATDKGSIPFPRMTYTERTGFTPSKTGTHVYQTNTASGFAEGVYVWKTSGWVFAY